MTKKPMPSDSESQKELDRVEKQFEEFDSKVQELTLDRMNAAPKEEQEPQTKISSKDLEKSKDVYLKPIRTVSGRDKFNEKFREKYEFDKQYVRFIAENKELIGETIDVWTRPYGGMPAEEWKVPVNTPVWGPRHLAEQIKRCSYHRLKMEDKISSQQGVGSFYGTMAVDTIVQRLDAYAAPERKSVFMGANNFP
jgi:hypothetical protein